MRGRDRRLHAARAPFAAIAPLYAGFLFCGIVTVLLGLLLPRIAALYHLNDSQCGALLTVQFGASASGALLVRRRYGLTLVGGYLLVVAGTLPLLLGATAVTLPAIAVAGLGLGMAMTSTSLLISRLFRERCGSALSLLNFFWSLGATLCPLLVAPLPARFSVAEVAAPVAAGALALAGAVLPGARAASSRASSEGVSSVRAPSAPLPILLVFAAVAFLYVGAEATAGGWMSTYAGRALPWSFARGNLAAGCFWGMLLLGRGVTPLVLRRVREVQLHRLSIAVALIGMALLVMANSAFTLLAGAACTGLALAPVFPLTLSLFLERVGQAPNAGWVFAAAGYGGMVFPLLTGFVSSGTHSLRIGLVVALAAVAGMLFLTTRLAAGRRTALESAPAGS
ncbi:MAG TPA: MFS transporter [Acidobacteriaceae bacterium]|nr:MFS transporter [Acidobacteriaceae bacterium]